MAPTGSDSVVVTLSQSGADAYTIRDYYGNIVDSGSVSGTTLTLSGTFDPGWYRVYLTGPNSDAVFGTSYGATNFVVLRDTADFSYNTLDDPVITFGQSGDDALTPVVKSVLGVGTSRSNFRDTRNANTDEFSPGSSPGHTFTGSSLWAARLQQTASSTFAPADPARPWPLWCSFSNGAVDSILLLDGSSTSWMTVYPANPAHDPEQIFVQVDPGSSSGTKVRVYYPDSSTLVETFDNLANGSSGATTINATSAYIKCFSTWFGNGATIVATAIGTGYKQGVVATVQYLYPFGITHYEGPSNEGPMTAETAHRMKLFQASVHAGNASAKAMGPCFVSLDSSGWDTFLAAGGGAFCDEISTHMYNSQTRGDINLGRFILDQWFNQLEANGISVPVWCTESTNVFNSVYGAYHPRRSNVVVLQTLLLEQYGVPRERNLVWYDISHGFWSFPSWLTNQNGSLNPHGVLYRVLAEETFGKLHHHAIDFGSVQANCIFLGGVYRNSSDDTSTAVLISHSFFDSATITLGLTGSAPASLTVVDGLGNESTVSVSGGLATVPVSDIPTYVRLPANVNCYVSSVNDWGMSPPANVAAYARATVGGTTAAPVIIDNAFPTAFGSGLVNSQGSTNADTLPDTAEVIWNSNVDVDRVIVFACAPWQPYSTLVDFDIQTTTDSGANWTTRQTVTKATPSAISFVTDSNDTGCTYETYWDEQWIFDVALEATYNCNGIRLYVRATSYGGEPIAAIDAAGMGQGNAHQHLCLEEIVVPSASSPTPYTDPYRSLVAGNSGLVGYWRCGEATGVSTAHTEVNSPTLDGTWVVDHSPGAVAIPGSINDGDTAKQTINVGHLSIPSNALLNVGDTFTIEFWHNVAGDSFTTNRDVLTKGSGSPKLTWDTGTIAMKSADGVTTVCHSSAPYTDTGWHHVVFTKSGSTRKVYLDGVDVTALDTNVTFTSDASAITFGWRGVDELALYNVALSAADVFDHFNASGTPAAVPLADSSFTTSTPKLSGSPAQGEQVQSSSGHWLNGPTVYTYQWQDSVDGASGWANIVGATRSDYVIASGEAGKYLRCVVSASNVVGASDSPQNSNVIGPVT